MSVRVQFEIGHEASVRTKKTPEGFTHDWEVFVRGADNTDIQFFVEKVVFYLHETFPKPKRVINKPPYVVKESGYAGFVLPIDVYLKNKEEPKKISFQYDLTLQPSGPPISRLSREPRLFQNPSEDFRMKLIRGGGVGVNTPSDSQTEDLKSASSISMSQNKSKITESPLKKHKPESASNHSFTELFGTPIRRVPEPKKLPELGKRPPETDLSKDKNKKISKHGPYRDEKEMAKEKEKYLEKEKNKERDRSKEKLPKRPPSPPVPIPQLVKPKDEHKKYEEKEKKKEEHDDIKKRKEDKKEKTKEVKEIEKQSEHKKEKKESKDGDVKKVNYLKLPHDSKPIIEKHGNENPEKERSDKEKHKHRHKKKEREKNRDKEKHRKDKEKNEKEREKEKSSKKRHEDGREKEEKIRRKSRSPSPSPVQERVKKGPLNALLDELGSSDSASPLSEEEPTIPSFKSFSKPSPKPAPVPEIKSQPVVNVTPKLKSTNLNTTPDNKVKKEIEKTPKTEENSLAGKNKKEKSSSKKKKKSEKEGEKRKSKEEQRPRSPSHSRSRSRSPSTEREEEDAEKDRIGKEEPERLEEEKPKAIKDKENRKQKKEKSEEKQAKVKKDSSSVAGSQSVEVADGLEEIRRSDKFTKEYVAQLRDLQHRIMTLEDNAELQKVVKVIAETGQYEITKKTFDFDLCALDFETVKRLQEFFTPT